jgi:hypothetical protein
MKITFRFCAHLSFFLTIAFHYGISQHAAGAGGRSGVTFVSSQALAQSILVDPKDTLNFGAVNLDAPSAMTVTIKNKGIATLHIVHTSSSSDDFKIAAAADSIRAGDTTFVTITFTPRQVRPYQDSIFISFDDSLRPTQRLIVIGKGVIVSWTLPRAYEMNAPDSTAIQIAFARPLLPGTVSDSSVIVTGSLTGRNAGTVVYENAENLLVYTPSRTFRPGEQVTVVLTKGAVSVAGDSVGSHQWKYTVGAKLGTGKFSPIESIVLDTRDQEPVVGDFDNNGYLDLAYVGLNSDNIFIARNFGSGVFTKLQVSGGSSPNAITSGDFDGDGLIDMAVTNRSTQTVTIIRQKPGGGFDTGTPFSIGSDPISITNADIDGDGRTDILVSGYYPLGGVYIFKNMGNLQFKLSKRIPCTNPPRMIAVSDLDGDGDPDLALASQNDYAVTIVEHLTGFEFSAPIVLRLSGQPLKLLCADFDGDGDDDIAVMSEYYDAVVFLRNDGGMKFSAWPSTIQSASPKTFFAADFDHDGKVDLVTAAGSSSFFSLYRNQGHFAFTASNIPYNADQFGAAAAADFDNDGDIDIAMPGRQTNKLLLFRNKIAAPVIRLLTSSFDFKSTKRDSIKTTIMNVYNDGGLQPLQISSIVSSSPDFTVAPASASIASGDTLHVAIQFRPAVARTYNDSITIRCNDSLNPVLTFHVAGNGDQLTSMYPAPFSCAASETTSIRIALGLALDPSTLTAASVRVTGSHTGNVTLSSITFERPSNVVTLTPARPLYKGEQVTVALTSGIHSMEGEPAFIPKTWTYTVRTTPSSSIFSVQSVLPVSTVATGIVLRDVNNDGLLDIVVVSFMKGDVTFYRNDGGLKFTLVKTLTLGGYPNAFVAEDFDNDGLVDFALPGSTTRFLKNTGNFTFTTITSAIEGFYSYMTTGDFDCNGYCDVITGTQSSDGEFVMMKNNGNFKFDEIIKSFSSVNALYSADFDGDGVIEIVPSQSSSYLIKNAGNFNFQTTREYFSSTFPSTTGDYNCDGKPDFAGTFFGGGSTYGVMINKGEFAFQELTKTIGKNTVKTIRTSDFNGDGIADLCILSDSGIVVTTNDGTGKFTEQSKTITPGVPWTMALGDLDNDGDDDCAIISLKYDNVVVLEQRNPFTEISLSLPGYNFSTVQPDSSRTASFDIQNIGNLPLRIDSLYASNPAFTVSPLSGVVPPEGALPVRVTFTAQEMRSYTDSITIISNDSRHAAAQFYVFARTEQSIVDSLYPVRNALHVTPGPITVHFTQAMVQASLSPSVVRVYGDKSGYHACTMVYTASSRVLTMQPQGNFIDGEVVTVQFLKDVRMESGIPVLSPLSWSYTVRVRDGSSVFTKSTIATGDTPEYLCAADLNNDGIADIALANTMARTLTIMRSNRDALPTVAASITIGSYVGDIQAGDLDADGNMDLIVNTGSCVTILKNLGNFTFTTIQLSPEPNIQGVTVADLDGDGDLDIATGSTTQAVKIFVNGGAMNFTPMTVPGTITDPVIVAAADFTNDGLVDIVVGKGSGNNLTLLRNEGALKFTAFQLPNVGPYVVTMAIADFDRDGRLDLFCPNSNSLSASVILNRGNVKFQNMPQSGIGYDALSLSGGDFDADGDIDVVSVNNGYSNTGSIYTNDSARFRQSSQFLIEPGSHNSTTGDFNADGAMDIAFVNLNSKSFSVLLNGKRVNAIQSVTAAPAVYALAQNYPNPFNPATTISFSLASKSFASLKIFDVMGRDVATVVSGEMPAGRYTRQWNASGCPSGVYFYRLQAGPYTETKKLLLIR